MQQQAVRSRVNCPERVLIRSDDDATAISNTGFSSFSVNMPTPILDPKRCQIIRTTIPNIQLQIPDYQLVFWYYNLPTATTAVSSAYLKNVRLFPSYYKTPTSGITFTPTINQYCSSPADLVTLLNLAAGAGGDISGNNPYWTAADVSFAYSTTTKQITMTGLSSGRFYCPSGWNDQNVLAAIALKNITCPTYPAAASTFVQPQLANYTLNLRVGYAMSGYSVGAQAFTGTSTLYANSVNKPIAYNVAISPDSYPCLVYTNTVALYVNFIQGSSLTSNNRHNLLCSVPMVADSLVVNSYVAATNNLMTKLSQTINTITVEMRDSADQPYTLPDSASVDVEISFSYQDKAY